MFLFSKNSYFWGPNNFIHQVISETLDFKVYNPRSWMEVIRSSLSYFARKDHLVLFLKILISINIKRKQKEKEKEN